MRSFAVILAATTVSAVLAAQSTMVRTLDGSVQGYTTSEARVFRGIPFGTAPVGTLRWKDPYPAQPWSGVRDATKDAPGCWQKCELPNPGTCPPTMSEDCLFLNVFTPLEAPATPAPVLFFIHGGDFKQGYAGGPLYDGSAIASETGTIVVATQYRVGALGFLHNNASITGNYGLADQRLALKWVQANIAAFGGDPKRVTISGQSAGAMSVASHLLNPACEGLFEAAILESEPFALHWRTVSEQESLARVMLKDAHCQDEACLMSLAPADVVAAQEEAVKDILIDLGNVASRFVPWTPTVGGSSFLTAQPITMFQQGKAMDVPIVAGTTQNEAWIFVYDGFTKPLPEWEYKLMFDLVLPPGTSKKVFEAYPVPADQKADARPTASEIVTHGAFKCATRNATLSHIAAGKQAPFVYHFDHVMSFSKFAWGPATFCDDKVCHGEELPFVFYPNVTAWGPGKVAFQPDEVDLAHSMGHYWGNFAATHTPGTGAPGAPLAWPQYAADTQQTMTFQTPANAVASKAWEEVCAFFDNEVGYLWP